MLPGVHGALRLRACSTRCRYAQRQGRPQGLAGTRPRASCLDEPFTAPRTPTESELAQIWSQVLKIDRVGIHDNFFDLGGHSLLTVRLSSEIAKAFKQNHPINFIYQNPTVQEMAAILRQGAVSHAGGTHPPIGARTDLQTRSFYFLNYPALLASHLGDVPAYSLGSYADDLRDYSSIEDIAMANIERLRVHQKEGPYRLSGFSGMALVAFEMARRLQRQGQEVSLLALIDPMPVGSIDRSSPSFPIWRRERFHYHLSRLTTVHPRSWLRYCQTRLFRSRVESGRRGWRRRTGPTCWIRYLGWRGPLWPTRPKRIQGERRSSSRASGSTSPTAISILAGVPWSAASLKCTSSLATTCRSFTSLTFRYWPKNSEIYITIV